MDRLVVKLFGGIFCLKDYINKTKFQFCRSILLRFYNSYLEKRNCYIGYRSQIKSPPIFPHGLSGIYISNNAIIGSDVVIYHQVTIGSNGLPDSGRFGSPRVLDNCILGAGSKIIGNCTVGENTRVGANAVVVDDIPANSIVVLQKSKVITKEQPLINRYYQKRNGKWGYIRDESFIYETDNLIVNRLNEKN